MAATKPVARIGVLFRTAPGSDSPLLVVEGRVTKVDIEDHDRLIDSATIEIDDPVFMTDAIDKGHGVLIEMGWEGEYTNLFEGVVVEAKYQGEGAAKQRVTVTAFDLSYLANIVARKEARSFEKKTLSEIVKEVARPYTPFFTVGKNNGANNVKPDPDLVVGANVRQEAGQTDWAFLMDLALEHRCRVFVEYNEGASQLYFIAERKLFEGDPMGKLHYCPGHGQVKEFNFKKVANAAAPKVAAAGINEKGEGFTVEPPKDLTAPALPTGPAQRPAGMSDADAKVYSQVMTMARAGTKQDAYVQEGFLAGYPSDAKAAERFLERDKTRLVGYHGIGSAVGTVMLRAKGKVKIDGLPSWASGDWYVTRVNHVYTRVDIDDGKGGRQDASTYGCRFEVTR